MSALFEIRVPLKHTKAKGLFILISRHKSRSAAERVLKREQKQRPDAFIHDPSSDPQWRAS